MTDYSSFIATRHFDDLLQALDRAREPQPDRSWLGWRRQCLARLGRFTEAADAGAALIATGQASGADHFRQAQILLRCRAWAEALHIGLRALSIDPSQASWLGPPVQAALAAPELMPALERGLRRLEPAFQEPPEPEPPPDSGRAGGLFAPLALPCYAPFDGAHSATAGMLGKLDGIAIDMPEHQPRSLPAALAPALPGLLAMVERLSRLDPRVDRAAAAAHVAARLPAALFPPTAARADFLSNVPLTLGQRPWLLWYDVPPLLFQPFEFFETTAISPQSASYHLIRNELESPACRAIITHYPGHCDALGRLFASPTIAAKTVAIMLHHTVPATPPQRDHDRDPGSLTLLFASSQRVRNDSFYYRGAVDVLNAFLELAPRHPRLRLVFRSAVPDSLSPRLRAALNGHPRIVWLPDHVAAADYQQILTQADLFLMPASVVYLNGLMEALRYGMVPVVADAWGIEDFIEHDRSGVIVPGRGHALSLSFDPPRLSYDGLPLLRALDQPSDPVFYRAWVAALEALLTDPERRERISRYNLAMTDRRFPHAEHRRRFQAVVERALI